MKLFLIFSRLAKHAGKHQDKRPDKPLEESPRESSGKPPNKSLNLGAKLSKQTKMQEQSELQLQLQRVERERWRNIQAEEPRLLSKLSFSNSLLVFIVVIICLTLLKFTASFSIPIVLALFLFMLLFPLVERLHLYGKLPYVVSCIVVLLLYHLLVFLLLILISTASFSSLLQALPFYQEKLQSLIQFGLDVAERYGLDLSQFFNQDWINKGLSSASTILSTMSGGISSFLSAGLSVFLMLLFLLLEGRAFFSTIERSFPPQKSQFIIRIYRDSVQQISSYLAIKTLVSLITGTLVSIGLSLIGVDFPLVWGILAFAANFVPSVGSIFHTALVFLFTLLQFSDELYWSLVALLFLLGVQFAIGNFLEPKLQGNRLRLSPVFILLFLYIWGYIWGITGMLLAVPILSVIKITCQNIPPLRTLAYFLENADFHKLRKPADKSASPAQTDTETEGLETEGLNV